MARDFNGSSDYLEVALALAYPFTLACWFRPGTDAATGMLMAACNSDGTDDDRITLQAAGGAAGDPVRCGAVTNGGSAASIDSTTGYTVGTWHHAAAVCASATSRSAFIDGGSKATTVGSRAMSGLNRLVLGAQRSGGALGTYYTGSMAEAAVWDIALDDADIARLASGLEPHRVRPESLVFLAPLVRDIRDEFGGLTFTTSGTTVVAHPRIFR